MMMMRLMIMTMMNMTMMKKRKQTGRMVKKNTKSTGTQILMLLKDQER
jgi:hypothetical protein